MSMLSKTLIYQLQPHLAPGSWMIDFELAVKNAVYEVFGRQVLVLCCYFHYAQSLWRQLQALGQQGQYGRDLEFRRYVNMFTALAFVNEDDIPRYFDTLVNSLPPNYLDDLRGFIDYFETNWIGRNQANPPRFARELWNVHQRY